MTTAPIDAVHGEAHVTASAAANSQSEPTTSSDAAAARIENADALLDGYVILSTSPGNMCADFLFGHTLPSIVVASLRRRRVDMRVLTGALMSMLFTDETYERPSSTSEARTPGDHASSVSNANANAVSALDVSMPPTPTQVGVRVGGSYPRRDGGTVGERVSKFEVASSRLVTDTRFTNTQVSESKPVGRTRQPDNADVSVAISRTTPQMQSSERVQLCNGLAGGDVPPSVSADGVHPLLTSATKTRAKPVRGSRRPPGRKHASSHSTSVNADGGAARNNDHGRLVGGSGGENELPSNTVASTSPGNVNDVGGGGNLDTGAASAVRRRFQCNNVMKTGENACVVCTKTVYPTERVLGTDRPCHRGCFRCAADGCGSTLNAKSYVSNGGKLLCPKHGEEAIATSPTGSCGPSPQITCALCDESYPQELFLLIGACDHCRSACVVCCANRIRAGTPRHHFDPPMIASNSKFLSHCIASTCHFCNHFLTRLFISAISCFDVFMRPSCKLSMRRLYRNGIN